MYGFLDCVILRKFHIKSKLNYICCDMIQFIEELSSINDTFSLKA